MTTPGVTLTDPRRVPMGLIERIRAYLLLAKLRIIELLLITTVPAMVLAADGWPGWWLVVATLGGGTLSAGGANAINNFVDRDIDSQMRRTRHRPLPAHRVGPREALVVGIGLGTAGFVLLWAAVNLPAALLSTAALLFYVLVYSMALKRTTPHNIVIGGAAGAVPVLVGWAAVTGTVELPAWILFAIVFAWTPPHFWALSLRYREDYERAGVPMLPVVAGERNTTAQIFLYTVVVAGLSLLLHPAAGLGMIYLVAAAVLGAWFAIDALRLTRDPRRAMLLFRNSNLYLALLFAAVALDVLV
jgi:protoheme IX farnesyltransferase